MSRFQKVLPLVVPAAVGLILAGVTWLTVGVVVHAQAGLVDRQFARLSQQLPRIGRWAVLRASGAGHGGLPLCLEVAHLGDLRRGHERHDRALRSGSSGATGAVEVRLGILGRIEVDHDVDVVVGEQLLELRVRAVLVAVLGLADLGVGAGGVHRAAGEDTFGWAGISRMVYGEALIDAGAPR